MTDDDSKGKTKQNEPDSSGNIREKNNGSGSKPIAKKNDLGLENLAFEHDDYSSKKIKEEWSSSNRLARRRRFNFCF